VRTAVTRVLGAIAGIGVGALFLAYAFRGVPVADVTALLRAGRWGAPAGLVLCGTVVFVVAKTLRWRLLLGGHGAPPFSDLVRPVTAGLALNALVPHAGEFVRAFALSRRHEVAASSVLSSIVAERVFDLFAVLILAALALRAVPAPTGMLHALDAIAIVAMLLAVLIVVAIVWPRPVRALAARCAGLFGASLRDRLLREVDAALGGLAPVRSVRTTLAVLAWSLVQWLAVAACTGGSAAVAGQSVGLAAALLVVVGIVIAFLLPNAPGYAGAVQVAFLLALAPRGVTPEGALAASIVYQLLMVLPLVIVGLAVLRGTLTRRSPAS